MLKEQRSTTMGNTEERLMEDRTVNLNGVDLHYRTIGDGPVLFLVPPGWGVASVYLQRAFSSLAKHLRLVFIDTRGSGLSGRPVDATRMGSVDMADDLEALRVHLDLAEISILGHSNSGAIAVSYAARYPDRVSKLVLIDSQVLGLSAAADTQRILQNRSTDPRFEEATRVVSTFFTGQVNPAASDESLESFIAQVLPLYLHSPERSLFLAQEQLSGPISSYAFASQFAADAAFPTDQAKSLGAIRAKVLIMVGRHDYICPVALSERLHEGIPESSLVIFEESGHLPWLEESDAFFAELERFLIS
jgi:proline iminopeptidase